MKTWTYRQITESAETTIKSMAISRDPLTQRMAWGVYFGWYCLTMEWQNDGDSERLEAMTKADNL